MSSLHRDVEVQPVLLCPGAKRVIETSEAQVKEFSEPQVKDFAHQIDKGLDDGKKLFVLDADLLDIIIVRGDGCRTISFKKKAQDRENILSDAQEEPYFIDLLPKGLLPGLVQRLRPSKEQNYK